MWQHCRNRFFCLNPVVSEDVTHSPRHPKQPRDYNPSHTHLLSLSLNIWVSLTASHMFPFSVALTFRPSVQWKAFWWTACAGTVNWCHVWLHFYTVHRRLLGSCPINGYKKCVDDAVVLITNTHIHTLCLSKAHTPRLKTLIPSLHPGEA